MPEYSFKLAVISFVDTILDWFHVSVRIRGLRNRSETEYYTKRLLTEHVSKLRWQF